MFKLFRYLKHYWWQIIIAFIFIVAQVYLQLLLPDCMSKIASITTDTMYSPETYTTIFSSGMFYFTQMSGDKVTDIWIIGGYMTAFSFCVLICAFGQSLVVSYIGANFGRLIRGDMFKKVESFSLGEYDKFGTASLITRTTNDIEQVQQLITMGLRIIVMSPVTLVVAVIMIVGKDARLALIIAFTIPVIIIVVGILLIIAAPLFRKIQDAIDRVTLVLRESLTGVRVVRAFNQEKQESERFDEANQNMTKMITKVGRVMSFANPVITILFDITYIGIFYYGFTLMDNVAVTGGVIDFSNLANVMASAQYAMQIMMSFMMFSMLLIMIPRASACAKRINAVLDTEISIKDPKNPAKVEQKLGTVEFKEVTFTFPDATMPTLSGISFSTKPGSTTAIIGSTGSGKSSIINLIPRFYDVTAGQVLVDNVDVRNYTQHDLREKIGFVPQQVLLFSGTIKDNLKFGNENATDEEINDAVRVAQAEHFISKKEEGLDSEVSQGGKNFSGGQKQRLAIARALVKRPEIYIFDDSFSALDFKTDIKLRTALKDYTKNSSVLIVAQRVSTIIDADNIIVLNDGKIVGQGTHSQLLKSCDVYREIVFSQLDEDEIKKTMQLGKQVLATEGGAE